MVFFFMSYETFGLVMVPRGDRRRTKVPKRPFVSFIVVMIPMQTLVLPYCYLDFNKWLTTCLMLIVFIGHVIMTDTFNLYKCHSPEKFLRERKYYKAKHDWNKYETVLRDINISSTSLIYRKNFVWLLCLLCKN